MRKTRGRPRGSKTKHRRSSTVEPIVVSPAVAEQMLGISHWKLYDMLRRGELDRVKFGTATRIPMDSIRRYLERSAA
jgi:excisionase family DNA binding protein